MLDELPSFLPLPGEHIVAQMNPAEMVRPLVKAFPEVENAFSDFGAPRKYSAVVYKVCELIKLDLHRLTMGSSIWRRLHPLRRGINAFY